MLSLEKARVRWFLSLDYNDIPEVIKAKGQRTYRSMILEGDEIDFSGGFTELHTKAYSDILEGNGYGLETARPSINAVHTIRNAKPVGLAGDYHPNLKKL